VEEWIGREQQLTAEAAQRGEEAEPGLVGYYRHVDGGVLDGSPTAFMGNSMEARCLDDVMAAMGKQSLGSNRGAVQAKLCQILDGLHMVGQEHAL
jgi:hypothetical protein